MEQPCVNKEKEKQAFADFQKIAYLALCLSSVYPYGEFTDSLETATIEETMLTLA